MDGNTRTIEEIIISYTSGLVISLLHRYLRKSSYIHQDMLNNIFEFLGKLYIKKYLHFYSVFFFQKFICAYIRLTVGEVTPGRKGL